MLLVPQVWGNSKDGAGYTKKEADIGKIASLLKKAPAAQSKKVQLREH